MFDDNADDSNSIPQQVQDTRSINDNNQDSSNQDASSFDFESSSFDSYVEDGSIYMSDNDARSSSERSVLSSRRFDDSLLNESRDIEGNQRKEGEDDVLINDSIDSNDESSRSSSSSFSSSSHESIASKNSMLSVSEIDELNDLLDKEENGESVDEDRIYELDLLSRWQIGEELTQEEKADVAAFKARRKEDKKRDFDAPAPFSANVL